MSGLNWERPKPTNAQLDIFARDAYNHQIHELMNCCTHKQRQYIKFLIIMIKKYLPRDKWVFTKIGTNRLSYSHFIDDLKRLLKENGREVDACKRCFNNLGARCMLGHEMEIQCMDFEDEMEEVQQ